MKCVRPDLWMLLTTTMVGVAGLSAQDTGEVGGRLRYSGTGQGVGEALVVLPGAGLGAFSEADGRYRIEAVPLGTYEVAPTLMGCQLASRSVTIEPGRRAELDFELSSPVVNLQGIVVTATVIAVTVNLVVDLLYPVFDPRVTVE